MKEIWNNIKYIIVNIAVIIILILIVHFIVTDVRVENIDDVTKKYEDNRTKIEISIDSLHNKEDHEIKGILIITNDSTLNLFKELCNE